MAEFPTYEKIAKDVAESVLDECLFNGKSIREWVQIIASADCISRAEVIKEVHATIITFFDMCEDNEETPMDDKDELLLAVNKAICNNIKAMKPITTQPKTGHWIMTKDYLTTAYSSIDYVKCSCCGEDSLEEGNYCPNCGAKMESEE